LHAEESVRIFITVSMTQAKSRFSTFEAYLSYEGHTDCLYELQNGELIEVPPGSGENFEIIDFFHIQVIKVIDFRRVRRQGLEIEVPGEPKNRYQDLTILQEEHIHQLKARNTIYRFMKPSLNCGGSRESRQRKSRARDSGMLDY
jgi:Uma2 family endonuclease